METIISAIFLMIIGGVGLFAILSALSKRNRFQSWSKAKGRVIERSVYKPSNAGGLSAPAFRYAPKVRYVYTINDKEYVGENLYHPLIQLPPTNKENWARKKVDSIPDEVTVNYNPNDPSDSFLLTSSKPIFTLLAFVCGSMVLIGALILLFRAT